MNYIVIIPARLASTRLPRKVLLDIHGKSMLQRVYEQAIQSEASEVLIATDSHEILDAAAGFGAECIMTSDSHASGTERLSEVVKIKNFSSETIIVNVQADEPLLPPTLINLTAKALASDQEASVATLAHVIHDPLLYRDPNVVKVVLDKQSRALYFSRASIPWDRDNILFNNSSADTLVCLRHIGLYAYRAGFIETYVNLACSPLEQIEQLEQLRVLWHGYKIHVALTDVSTGMGVDTVADLETVRQLIAREGT
jgi:3-deoxy-manno-octulosonate cytidylyltransferase (CMP-KDO synthetase)